MTAMIEPKLRRIGTATSARLTHGATIRPIPHGYLIALEVSYGLSLNEMSGMFIPCDREFSVVNALDPEYFPKLIDSSQCGVIRKQLIIARFGRLGPMQATNVLARFGFQSAGIEECAALFRTPHLRALCREANVVFPRGAEKKTVPIIFPPERVGETVSGVYALHANTPGDWGDWEVHYSFVYPAPHYYVGVRCVR